MSDSRRFTTSSGAGDLWTRIRKQPELLLALGLIGILLVILVPLPGAVVDPLLIFNITVSLLVLMTAAGVLRPLEFSVFPSLLLVTTFFRLALNIATTRLILGNAAAGSNAAGKVVETFGTFVGGDNLVIGLVVFTVIVVVQFVVITRGSTRVSEVAARFQLDAMPGKQLAIDNDLSSGQIDQLSARERREEVSQEADFYGAMDGASKFVRGDAVAGIVIMFVNLVGGACVGVFRHDMGLVQSLDVFGRLTIGDGLVSQVPALMVSVAAALLVTRSTANKRLGSDIGRQLFSNDRILFVAAVFLLIMTPTGLPIPALVLTSAACVACGWILRRERLEAAVDDGDEASGREAATAEEVDSRPAVDARALLRVECLELEIGYRLVSLVSEHGGGDLLVQLAEVRRRLALELGLVVPSIRVADSRALQAREYSLKLRGNRLGVWRSAPGGFLALAPACADPKSAAVRYVRVDDERTAKRAEVNVGGRCGRWIAEDEADGALAVGLELLRPGAGIAAHLDALLRTHAAEILSREEASRMVADLRDRAPGLVDDIVPSSVTLSDLHRTLQELLRESVSVRDLEPILETLAECSARGADQDAALQSVRSSLSRSICASCAADDGRLHAALLDPALEEFLQGSLEKTFGGPVLALDPRTVDSIGDRTAEVLRGSGHEGRRPTVLCAPAVRAPFWKLVRKRVPDVAVLSYEEVLEEVPVEVRGSVSLDRLSDTSSVRQEVVSEG